MKNKIQEINISESTALLPDDVVPIFTPQDFNEKFFCQWKYDSREEVCAWITDCNSAFTFPESKSSEYIMVYCPYPFCPYCGRQIKEVE